MSSTAFPILGLDGTSTIFFLVGLPVLRWASAMRVSVIREEIEAIRRGELSIEAKSTEVLVRGGKDISDFEYAAIERYVGLLWSVEHGSRRLFSLGTEAACSRVAVRTRSRNPSKNDARGFRGFLVGVVGGAGSFSAASSLVHVSRSLG